MHLLSACGERESGLRLGLGLELVLELVWLGLGLSDLGTSSVGSGVGVGGVTRLGNIFGSRKLDGVMRWWRVV